MTVKILEKFGVNVGESVVKSGAKSEIKNSGNNQNITNIAETDENPQTLEVYTFNSPGSSQTPENNKDLTIEVETDFSQLAVWIVANVIQQNYATTKDIESGKIPQIALPIPENSIQGDRVILDYVSKLGSDCNSTDEPLAFDMTDCPDLVPVFAVACALSGHKCKLYGVERLRIKESDRIATTIEMLENLGGIAEYVENTAENTDENSSKTAEENSSQTAENSPKTTEQNYKTPQSGLYIDPVDNFTGGTVNAHNDHRLAMAAAIATIRSTAPVTILGAECVEKSYPDFWNVYSAVAEYTSNE
jgi:3-phosphoshikimate 1-carboxyvinyltransferase